MSSLTWTYLAPIPRRRSPTTLPRVSSSSPGLFLRQQLLGWGGADYANETFSVSASGPAAHTQIKTREEKGAGVSPQKRLWLAPSPGTARTSLHTCRGRETLSGAGAGLSDLTLWPSALGRLQALVWHRPAEAPSLPSPSQYSPPQASLASRVPSVSPRALTSLSWDPSESRWREVGGIVRMVGRRLGLWGWESGSSTPP